MAPRKNTIHSAVEYGMIPEELKNFRQENFVVFYLESTETEMPLNTSMDIDGVHKVVSIGVSSSLPVQDQYFVRKSSSPQHSTELVAEFLDFLFETEKIYRETVPKVILDAVSDDVDFNDDVCDKVRVERELRKYLSMPVYGYNSGKYIS